MYDDRVFFKSRVTLERVKARAKGVIKMAVSDEIRRYMDSLQASFQSSKAGGIEAIIQVNFTDPSSGSWFIAIRAGECAVKEGTAEDATITVDVDPNIWLDIQKGKIMANMAVSRNKMRLSGDLSLAFQLGSCFALPGGMKFSLL
jgi:putative sterol carrier protein